MGPEPEKMEVPSADSCALPGTPCGLWLKPNLLDRLVVRWSPARWTVLWWLLGHPPNHTARIIAEGQLCVRYAYAKETPRAV